MSRKLFGVGAAVSGMLLCGAFARADSDSTVEAAMSAVKDEAPGDGTTSAPTDQAPKSLIPLPPPRSEVTVIFRNEVGKRFQVVEARFTLDGIALPTVLGDARRGQEYVIRTGEMGAGRHMVAGRVRFRGQSRSIFTYLKGYVLSVDTQKAIYAVSGVPATVWIVAKDHKGFNVPYDKSIAVAFEERLPASPTGPTIAKAPASDAVVTLR